MAENPYSSPEPAPCREKGAASPAPSSFRPDLALKQIGAFAWKNKAWWIMPLVLVFLLLMVLVATDPLISTIYVVP